MVVGPPGTGKTDTAVQVLNVLYHNCPSQRTLIITHSNQALNDLFEKIMQVWMGCPFGMITASAPFHSLNDFACLVVNLVILPFFCSC